MIAFKASNSRFSVFSSGGQFVYQSETSLAILVEGHLGNILIVRHLGNIPVKLESY